MGLNRELLLRRRHARGADRRTRRIHQAIPQIVSVRFHVPQVFEPALPGAGVDGIEPGGEVRASQDAIDLTRRAQEVSTQAVRARAGLDLLRALPHQAVGAVGSVALDDRALSARRTAGAHGRFTGLASVAVCPADATRPTVGRIDDRGFGSAAQQRAAAHQQPGLDAHPLAVTCSKRLYKAPAAARVALACRRPRRRVAGVTDTVAVEIAWCKHSCCTATDPGLIRLLTPPLDDILFRCSLRFASVCWLVCSTRRE